MASVLNCSSPTLPHPNFSHTISIKLTPDNYLLWKVQLVPYLRGQRLYKYVDGTCPPPKPELDNNSPNPAYDVWLQQYPLVMSALISSLSDSIITQVVGCTSAWAIWLSLQSSYASVSQARLIQTQLQLASLKKGSYHISSYFRKAKVLADTMVATGRPLAPDDFLPYLLAWLGPNYDALSSFVATRLEPISLDELLGHCLAHEARLLHHSDMSTFF